MITIDNQPPKALPAKKSRLVLMLALIIFVLIGLVAAAVWFGIYDFALPLKHADDGAVATLSSRLDGVEDKIRRLESRMAQLDQQTPNTVAPTAKDEEPASPAADARIGKMQSDLAALDASVNGMQADIKQTAATLAAARNAISDALAETIAYLRLHDVAASGHGFTNELATLRAAARDDKDLPALLDTIAGYAENGAPTLAALRDRLLEQGTAAEQAIARAGAQGWWQRVIIEIKGLVSIRKLHGAASANDTINAMAEAVTRDDLAAALENMKSLPPEAQNALADWRREAEARHAIDEALQKAGDAIVARAGAASRDTP